MPRSDKQKDKEYQKIWVKNNPEKIKQYSKKYRENNKEKQREANRKWRLKNPKYRKQYYEQNKETETTKSLNYKKIHPELYLLASKKYRKNNKENINLKARKNYTPENRKSFYEKNKEHNLLICKLRRQKLFSILIWHYSYGTYRCACCGFNEGKIFLELDHINGHGNTHRKAIGTGNFHTTIIKHYLPKAYQVLCSNCNRAKFRNGGICPHKETPSLPVQAQEN